MSFSSRVFKFSINSVKFVNKRQVVAEDMSSRSNREPSVLIQTLCILRQLSL